MTGPPKDILDHEIIVKAKGLVKQIGRRNMGAWQSLRSISISLGLPILLLSLHNRKITYISLESESVSHSVSLTLCNSMDCSPPVHGILQARILEWAAIPFSRGSSQPRDRTQVSCIAGGFFTNWATREAQDMAFSKPHASLASDQ